jgi:cobalt-zinc-cadmium efflux system outer membrane protein
VCLGIAIRGAAFTHSKSVILRRDFSSDFMNHPFYFHFFLLTAFVQVLLAPPGLWAGQNSLSLEEVTQKALARNPTIAAARARWRIASKRIPQEAAWEDPTLNFRSVLGRFVQIPPNGFTDQTVSLEQSIPISGKNRSRERAAAAEAGAAFQELRRQELDVVSQVRSAFIQLANDYELLKLKQAEETTVAQTIDNTRTKFEVGKQQESDILIAQIERQKVSEERQDLEQKLSTEETRLKLLMDVDAFESLGRPDLGELHAVNLDPPKLRSRILLNNPEVLQANAQLAAAQARYQLAKRAWIPDPNVSIEADHYNAGSQIASEVSGGISISLPWFNEKKYSAAEQEALDRVTAAQNAFEAAKSEVIGKLRDQLQKIQTLHHHAGLYENSLIPGARQNVSANQTDYQTDKTTFQNLLSSQRNLWEVESIYHQLLTDYQIALAELESLLGSNLGIFGGGTEKLVK